MTPKEKAEDLVNKFINYRYRFIEFNNYNTDIQSAKNCALIAVDEIINCIDLLNGSFNDILYWQEVKQEIEKL